MEFNLSKLEEKILKFWEKNKIFEKTVSKKAPNFVFFEGPPTANGRPGLHHILTRSFKDIICRYKTMRGFRVVRKAGWDTHGLPVELEVEKKLGLKSKKEVEKYGIARFNKKCKASVWEYKKEWEKLTARVGFWLDMKNPYVTYTNDYIETVWWILKKIWEKGLLYQDYKVVPYCPRCETALSSHEVAQGYKTVKENSVYVKFPVKNQKDTYFLVWTTTPWTLPGNVALAINKSINYVKAKEGNEFFILAESRLGVLTGGYEVLAKARGEDLNKLTGTVGKLGEYSQIFNYRKLDPEKSLKVVIGDFVSDKDGTGIVHIAPTYGEDDMNLANKEGLEKHLMYLNKEGKFEEGFPWSGKFAKDADPDIVTELKKRSLFYKEEIFEHEYPFCWRCKTPLLYCAKKSWFIKMAGARQYLIENNQKINWMPAYIKEGRFGEWLKDVKDWAISRERYWGTPLPVWRCGNCNNTETVGSLKEILSQKFSTNNFYIVRHGHSLRQVKKLSSSWPEKTPYSLTDEGRKEAELTAKELKKKNIDLIFFSDLSRTKETAEIIAKETGAKLIFDKRLREWNVGTLNDKDPKLVWDYINKHKDISSRKLPKGESLIDIQKRMYGFLESINGKYKNKNIAIVSHELPLTILENTLKGLPLREILELRNGGGINRLKTGEWKKIEFKALPMDEKMNMDFHRPYVDKVIFRCKKCQGTMERVPEVIDVWFDSGAMPFAQYHYPFENKKLIDKKNQFPADYICEAIDQTRGWFYTLLAVSTLLEAGNPYKNAISCGHVLDEKGEKMSKSKGNIVDPWHIIGKYGADVTRWYFYTINQPGDPKSFSEKDIDQALKKFILTLWNSVVFFETYKSKSKGKGESKSKNILDRWILSKLNHLILDATDSLDKYDIIKSARMIESFAVNDLSLWYIRRSRRRFQKPETRKEQKEASQTLNFILLTLSKLAAPFIPFLSDHIYQKFYRSKSVHLDSWPKAKKAMINEKLEKDMEKTREAVSLALAERAKSKIKIRQPLGKLQVTDAGLKNELELLNLIKEEVNIKEIIFGKDLWLDTKITPELREEGIIRDVIRQIQGMRKEKGLKPKNKILVQYSGPLLLNEILIKHKDMIIKETKANDFISVFRPEGKYDAEKEISVDQDKIWLGIKLA